MLVLQNEIPDASNAAAAQAAKESGAIVVLNAAPARELGHDLVKNIDVLVVNRIEAEMMSGAAVTNAETAIAALPKLGAGARSVVITLGSAGLVLQGKEGPPVFLAPHPVRAASSHGAGDCFLGALTAQLAAGNTLLESCGIANWTASMFVAMSERERAEFDFSGH